MSISKTNKVIILKALNDTFQKIPFTKGGSTSTGCEQVGIVVDQINTPQLAELTKLVNQVPDNMTIKRSGKGISVSFS